MNNASIKPKRLFDCIAYQLQNFPVEDMFAAKENGSWKKYSTAEVKEKVDQISGSLLELGMSAGDGSVDGRDKIAIISQNCPGWMLTDLAIQQIGVVSVPVYPNININELQFILQDAGVKVIFVGDEELFQKITAIKENLPALEKIFSFKPVAGADDWSVLVRPNSKEMQAKVDYLKGEVEEHDLVTILYTSGTTGTPKGVMLSHYNIVNNVFDTADIIEVIGIKGKRAISFLPLNHAFERMATYCLIYCGTSIYYAESIDKLAENLKEVKPTIFTTVPRLLEKIYEGILAKGSELTGVKKKLFFWALKVAEQYEIDKPLSPGYRLQLAVADKLIFSKWRAAFGGEIKAVATGAAACQVRLLRIFTAAKIVIQEGYGLTEASPIISANRYDKKNRKFGTVGPLLNQVEVKIAEDGEILCKGPNVMMGYYKRPDLTAEVMEGEWLRTGDIGKMIDGEFLKITDRKKELFKTSGGKYVAPQPIENKMVESSWIEQIMVVGELQKYVGALIVPAFQQIRDWYERQGKSYPGDQEAIRDEFTLSRIQEEIKEFNRHFNPVEQVKKFVLMSDQWTVEGGELTPTLKLKRRNIMEKYEKLIVSMYAPQVQGQG